jgi:hypothetical protein
MDTIHYTGFTTKEIKELKTGSSLPRVCYVCRRKENDMSYGLIREESGKIFYNKPVIDLGEINRKIDDGVYASYLVCPECAVLLGIEKDLKFSNNSED